MSDWNGWPPDGSDFDGADSADTADLNPGYGEDGDYARDGFGLSPDELPGTGLDDGAGLEDGLDDELTVDNPLGYAEPLGYDGGEGHVEEPSSPLVGFGSAEAPVGADPDLDVYADSDTWPRHAFPEVLDLRFPPEPVDGPPWTDPTALGDGDVALPDPATAHTGAPDVAELADYAGHDTPDGADAWSALVASTDPATSVLARWWSPHVA